jgi:hypothetical protein
MPKPKQAANDVDNTSKAKPRPEENPASKEAYKMFLGQLQRKQESQKRFINDAGPAPVYKNVGEKVRADLERESRQRDLAASIPNEKLNAWAENVGIPVADIAAILEAPGAGKALLRLFEEKGAPETLKNIIKSNVENEVKDELVQKDLFGNKVYVPNNLPEDVRALADANRDALTFSNSPYNKAKMQAFRPGQTFDITNTEAMFPDNPKALELLNKIKKDKPQDFGNETIESLVGEKGDEGRYLARDAGDLEDLAVVRRGDDYRKVYDATVHELGHSRSIRNASTDEERKILNDAWFGLNHDDVLEQEAVQHELRMRLGDKLGNRVYTEKDIPEIKSVMQDFVKRKHPYVTDANKFDYSKIVNSLNKIGAAAVTGATTKKLLSDKTVQTLKKKANG